MNQFYEYLWDHFDDRWLSLPAFIYIILLVGVCWRDNKRKNKNG